MAIASEILFISPVVKQALTYAPYWKVDPSQLVYRLGKRKERWAMSLGFNMICCLEQASMLMHIPGITRTNAKFGKAGIFTGGFSAAIVLLAFFSRLRPCLTDYRINRFMTGAKINVWGFSPGYGLSYCCLYLRQFRGFVIPLINKILEPKVK